MKRKAETKKGPAKKPSTKGLPEHVYCPGALTSLRIGLRGAARKRQLLPEEGDRMLWRLSGPLKSLENLYQLAKAMFAGDQRAEEAFRNTMLRLIRHAPEGGVKLLRQRTGLPNLGNSPTGVPPAARAMVLNAPGFRGRPGLDCSVIFPEGMATLYLATLRAGLGELTQPGLDVLATLSIGQGRMEGLNGALVGRGPDGLEDRLQSGWDPGMPKMGQPGDDIGWAGYQPDPDNPPGPDDPWGGWRGGGPGGWLPPPPDRGSCQAIREACEAMFIEQVNTGLPAMPMPPNSNAYTWSDNIDNIEMLGHCADDKIIIHGHGFGNSQPHSLKIVMNVNGGCAVVPAQSWTDTRIEVILPTGIRSGAVGFYDQAHHQAEVDRYNGEASTFNSAAREMMTASKCMGQPLDLNLFPRIVKVSVVCPPEDEHNVIEAGLPVIHFFYAATDSQDGAMIVADPDDEIVLRWKIENADAISLRGLSPTGPSVPATVEANSSSFELGAPGHSQFERFSYRIRATNECGSTERQVEIVGSKRPGLAIQRLEVTQGIQTLDGDVQLVAGKPTVVRTYITHGLGGFGDNTVPLVKGSMSVYSNGIYQGSFYPVNGVAPAPPDPPAPDINASITVSDLGDPPPLGLDEDDTLNFVIPASLCTGTLELDVRVHVDSFGPPDAPGFYDSANADPQDFSFRQRKQVKLRFIPVTIAPDAVGNPSHPFIGSFANPPTDQECIDFLSEMLKLLPVTASSIERLDGWSITFQLTRILITTPWGRIDINSGWSESLVYDIEGNVYTSFLGVLRLCELGSVVGVCTEDTDAIWAVLVPVSIWGRANWTPFREFISPMTEISCAHELAHCLNQQHLAKSGCRGGSNPVTGRDDITDAANWEDLGRILEEKAVPFDVIQNRTITDNASGVWDLMTYCVTRWTTPRRWDLVFNFLGS